MTRTVYHQLKLHNHARLKRKREGLKSKTEDINGSVPNDLGHIAPTIPTPMTRNVIPVCSSDNPCFAKISWNARESMPRRNALYALSRRVMWWEVISRNGLYMLMTAAR